LLPVCLSGIRWCRAAVKAEVSNPAVFRDHVKEIVTCSEKFAESKTEQSILLNLVACDVTIFIALPSFGASIFNFWISQDHSPVSAARQENL
jgi:hypothetical protein